MRIGIVGYGHIGVYMVNFIRENGVAQNLELAFVWNRSAQKLHESNIPKDLILDRLEDAKDKSPDLIVEVAHPCIGKQFGKFFLSIADFFMGSPSILSDEELKSSLYSAVVEYNHSLYLPSGAMWGANDIQRMAKMGVLKSLQITMAKHPSAFRLVGDVKAANDAVIARAEDCAEPVTLIEAPVREICRIAPVNVNTMAIACIAAENLGFDGVTGRIISDPRLNNWHVIDVEVTGPTIEESGNTFSLKSTRRNPASSGAVTGNLTLASICGSLCLARGRPAGVHIC